MLRRHQTESRIQAWEGFQVSHMDHLVELSMWVSASLGHWSEHLVETKNIQMGIQFERDRWGYKHIQTDGGLKKMVGTDFLV